MWNIFKTTQQLKEIEAKEQQQLKEIEAKEAEKQQQLKKIEESKRRVDMIHYEKIMKDYVHKIYRLMFKIIEGEKNYNLKFDNIIEKVKKDCGLQLFMLKEVQQEQERKLNYKSKLYEEAMYEIKVLIEDMEELFELLGYFYRDKNKLFPNLCDGAKLINLSNIRMEHPLHNSVSNFWGCRYM